MISALTLDPATTRIGEVAGRPVALAYDDTETEYAALRRGALLVDRSHRHRLMLSGDRAAEMLTGLVTNDVKSLAPGHGQYAAALTAKGKIVADLRIFALESGEFLVDSSARAADGWMQIVRKYINPRWAPYRDVSEALTDIGIFGARASSRLAPLLALDASVLDAMAPYEHLRAGVGEIDVRVARVPDAGVTGFELFVPSTHAADVWNWLRSAPDVVPGGLEAWEIARVEAGRPEWGLDMDEMTIPQEANFDDLHAISYTKGCYTGQETVARVHFRGHVNRHLRGLRAEGSDPLPAKAELVDSADKIVGEVRTSIHSPRIGTVAIGMVRREVPLGQSLRARWAEGERAVEVTALPFVD